MIGLRPYSERKMPNTSEENQRTLEKFLDSATVNFFRETYDQHRIYGYNGTALGITSIQFGGYPLSEGSYEGLFPFVHEKGRVLAIVPGEPFGIEGRTFLRARETGTSHKIHYIKLPEGFDFSSVGVSVSERVSERVARFWKTLGDPQYVEIGDKEKDALVEFITHIKECEFRTLQHYANQMKKRDKKEIGAVYDHAITHALDPANIPQDPMYSAHVRVTYGVRGGVEGNMVLKYPLPEKPGIFPGKVIIPRDAIIGPLADLLGIGSVTGHYTLIPGKDPGDVRNWHMFKISNRGWMSEDETRVYFKDLPAHLPQESAATSSQQHGRRTHS